VTVPEIDAAGIREEYDSIELKHVQRLGDLTQTSLDVRQ
jgi:hypothetical protein